MQRRGSLDDGGSVTAELAMAMLALAAVTAFAMWAVTAVAAEGRCLDAAREAARLIARGVDDVDARSAALESAPRGAVVQITRAGSQVTVVVTAAVGLTGRASPAHVDVQGRAVSRVEPGVP